MNEPNQASEAVGNLDYRNRIKGEAAAEAYKHG